MASRSLSAIAKFLVFFLQLNGSSVYDVSDFITLRRNYFWKIWNYDQSLIYYCTDGDLSAIAKRSPGFRATMADQLRGKGKGVRLGNGRKGKRMVGEGNMGWEEKGREGERREGKEQEKRKEREVKSGTHLAALDIVWIRPWSVRNTRTGGLSVIPTSYVTAIDVAQSGRL